jgi:glycosyltransferase involved in cell wall biosynthesis
MLSVVLATYNEEKNIVRCLEAVKEIADEIIVVDGSSSDNTVKLAEKLGAKVISTTNKPNFHINKQMAMDAAKGEVILQLDADEVVDEELASFISSLHDRVLKNDDTIVDVAWWVRRKNLFLGHWLKKGGQYPDPVIRLYLAGKARLPQHDVHEQMTVDGSIGWADGHFLHYANPSFADYMRKWQTYTTFKANQLSEQGLKVTFFTTLNHLLVKPLSTFLSIFVRHKGFVDGVPGFVFALMSGLHHAYAYLLLIEKYRMEKS